jgi:hypothetical protein
VSDDEPVVAPIAAEPARRRRKKKRKRAPSSEGGDRGARRAGPEAPDPEAALGSRTATILGAATALVAAAVVGASGTTPSGYALLALGVGAFVAGASYDHPRRTVLAAMGVAAGGLAWLALSSSPWAISVAVGGGMGLAGGIHLLGRMGPDEARGPFTRGAG